MFSGLLKGHNWILAVGLLLSATYLSFFASSSRITRMTGDEKVYINQSLEMEARGTWVKQQIFDSPRYFKGPMHYILTRLGFIVFGHTIFATLYMNLLFVLLGAFAVGFLIARALPHLKDGPLLGAALVGLSPMTFSHMWASQMEIELLGMTALCAYFIFVTPPQKSGLLLWTLIGVLSWIKSPLHSVLIGLSAWIYWASSGTFYSRIKSPGTWLSIIFGILVAIAGYVPSIISDSEAFFKTFVGSEHTSRPDNGTPLLLAARATFGYDQVFWLPLYLFGIFQLVKCGYQRQLKKHPLLLLSIAISLPSLIFFTLYPYRVNNYLLPIICGPILLTIWALSVASETKRRKLIDLNTYTLFAFCSVIVIAIPWIHIRIEDSPFTPLSVGFFAITLVTSGITSFVLNRPSKLPILVAAIYIAITPLLIQIGEADLSAVKEESKTPLTFVEMRRNIWSEWGLISLSVKRRTFWASSSDQIERALSEGHTLVVHPREQVLFSKKIRTDDLLIEDWPRWGTLGRKDRDEPAWKIAWKTGSLSPLKRPYWLVRRDRASENAIETKKSATP